MNSGCIFLIVVVLPEISSGKLFFLYFLRHSLLLLCLISRVSFFFFFKCRFYMCVTFRTRRSA